MTATPEALQECIRAYYRETTERSYLRGWSGGALALHFGLSDGDAPSHDDSLLETNRLLAYRANIGPGCRVLDAGCGVGGTAIWLAAECGAEVTGITLSPEQVRLARGFAASRGVEALTSFVCGDFMDTGFEEGSFDVILNVESLCHAHDARAYLQYAFSLLRDGGRFACIDMFDGDKDPAAVRTICEGWVLPALHPMECIADWMSEIGFVSVSATDLTPKTRDSASRVYAMAESGLCFLQAEKLIFGSTSLIMEQHARAALAAADALRTGGLSYGFVRGVRPVRPSCLASYAG